jgi:hypothetical protein
MSRLVIVLATHHELQGAEKRAGNVNDPLYAELLEELVEAEGLDFIFEEATGLGPTIAEKLSQAKLGAKRYLDVDPPRGEREKLGIPTDTNKPFMIGTPPDAAFANWELHQVHAKREELWIQRMMEWDFKKSLMICGLAHALSFTFRLQSAKFTVKTATYVPVATPATPATPVVPSTPTPTTTTP